MFALTLSEIIEEDDEDDDIEIDLEADSFRQNLITLYESEEVRNYNYVSISYLDTKNMGEKKQNPS